MVKLGDKISGLNKRSSQNIELSQTILTNNKDSLNKICSEIINLTATSKEHEDKVTLKLQNIGDRFINRVEQEVITNNKQVQLVVQKMEQSIKHISRIQADLNQLLYIAQQSEGVLLNGNKSNKNYQNQ